MLAFSFGPTEFHERVDTKHSLWARRRDTSTKLGKGVVLNTISPARASQAMGCIYRND